MKTAPIFFCFCVRYFSSIQKEEEEQEENEGFLKNTVRKIKTVGTKF